MGMAHCIIPFRYWDGSGHRQARVVKVKAANHPAIMYAIILWVIGFSIV